MKILVVGGAGYIGSHVTKELLKNGYEVTVFDNLSTGLCQNLFKEAHFVQADILDVKAVEKAFSQGFDAFFHLAALKAAGESMFFPEKYSVHNITGTLNLMNAAVQFGCKKMVFSSSAAVFGEPKYLPIDEKHPKDPTNYYGFTKLKIEEFMGWYSRLKGLRFAVLRYFNAAGYDPEGILYGLEQNPQNLLPIIMEVAMGKRKQMQIFGTDYDTKDGTCIRDYVHVSDLALAHIKALDYISKKDKDITVNLGSETGISVLEMIEAARAITGKKIDALNAPRRQGDPACLYATSNYAKKTLGWRAQYSDITTLISSTYNAYKKNATESPKE